jgi:expansin
MRIGVIAAALAGCSGGEPVADVTPPAACTPAPAEATGQGTYYAATGAGNCGFEATPGDLMVAALNHVDYGIADWCGACLEVTGPQGVVTVRIVDSCPGCAKGDLDLSEQAFAVISPLSAGRVAITWQQVPCEVAGPIAYHFKDGANAFWTAIQLRNHRYPIAKLEALVGGNYAAVPRVDYNYFVQESGLGDGPYTLRVTDTRGHVLEDSGIALGNNITRSGAGQFPTCP